MFETLIGTHKNNDLVLQKKILLVEHDVAVGNYLLKFFQEKNYDTHYSHSGFQARDIIENNYFDMIVIDLSLPFKDAYSLATAIQNSKPNIPVIFLANSKKEKQMNPDKIVVYKKDFAEGFAKAVQTLENSSQDINSDAIFYSIGKYTLNTKYRLLSFGNETPVKLSPKENKLLRILIQNKGEMVTKEHIIKKVWYNNDSYNLKSIGVYITKMRKLLSKDPNLSIQNVYKTGFILVEK